MTTLRMVLLLIPLIVLAALTDVSALPIVTLNYYQANSITIASIAYGGANYMPGREYLYDGFLFTPRPDYTRLVKVTNEATQQSISLSPFVEGWPSWYVNGVHNIDGWMTLADIIAIAATYTT
jgi:hypothetical protein